MTDSVTSNGEMTSKALATSILNEIGVEPTDAGVEPLSDACHRFLEAGVSESEILTTMSELLSELQRSGTLNNQYEESELLEEEADYPRNNLFNPRDDDAY